MRGARVISQHPRDDEWECRRMNPRSPRRYPVSSLPHALQFACLMTRGERSCSRSPLFSPLNPLRASPRCALFNSARGLKPLPPSSSIPHPNRSPGKYTHTHTKLLITSTQKATFFPLLFFSCSRQELFCAGGQWWGENVIPIIWGKYQDLVKGHCPPGSFVNIFVDDPPIMATVFTRIWRKTVFLSFQEFFHFKSFKRNSRL